jgi:AcrR family transcriptional regulator
MYRGLVCDAAERVFAAHGFLRARMSQIARESGVSIGTIYRVFPGRKDEIYRAIQENRGTELIGRTRAIGEAAWRQRGDLLDAMLAGVAATVDFFAAHPDYLRLVLREEKGWAGGAKRRSAEQTAMWHEGVNGIVSAMRFGIAERLLVDDNAETMARTWVAIQEAHLGHWVEQGMRATPAEVAARFQRQILRAFCRPEVLATCRLPEVTTTPERQPGTPPPPATRSPESARASERRRES